MKLDIRLPDPPIFYPAIQALWMVVKATVPVAIGAGLTLLGVWKTNLHQEKLQRQAKEEDRKFWQVQRNYELKRDALKECNALLRETEFHFRSWLRLKDSYVIPTEGTPSSQLEWHGLSEAESRFKDSGKLLARSIGEAELYVSADVVTALHQSQDYFEEGWLFRGFGMAQQPEIISEMEARLQTAIELSKVELRMV